MSSSPRSRRRSSANSRTVSSSRNRGRVVGPLLPPNQALVDQRSQPLQHADRVVPGHGRRRLGIEPAGEDPQAPEERLLVRRQQVVGPGDGVAHRPMPVGPVALAAGEEAEALAQQGAQRRDREDPQPGRRQLDRQRQPVQPRAHLGHRPRVAVGEGEAVVGRAGALDEQGDRFDAAQRGDGRPGGGVGQGQGRHRQQVLPPQPQGGTTGGQHLESGAGPQQLGDGRGGVQQVLAVVKEQQELPRPEERGEGGGEGAVPGLADAERRGDRRQDQGGVA